MESFIDETLELSEALSEDYLPSGELLVDGPVCQRCGCSDLQACPGGCVWATPDLCSRCVG